MKYYNSFIRNSHRDRLVIDSFPASLFYFSQIVKNIFHLGGEL